VGKASSDIRHQLILLSGSRKTRRLGWPRDWRPGQVVGSDGQPLNLNQAWELVHELLANDACAVEEIDLYDPPGKTGYVIKWEIIPISPPLYVKLELASGMVIGRSFHFSIDDRNEK
jgi:hypothetical protein